MDETAQKLSDFSPSIVEAWATYECLRNLGFTPAEISWVIGRTLTADHREGLALNVVLQAQGKTFTATVSDILGEDEARKLEDEARRFYEVLVSGEFAEDDLRAAYEGSRIWREKTQLVVAISEKGFKWPFMAN